jgi:O-antigen polymerase
MADRCSFIILSIILLFLMHLSIPNMGGTVAHPREYLIWFAMITLVLIAAIKVIQSRSLIVPSFLKYFIAYIIIILSTSIFNPIYNTELFIINSLRLLGTLAVWFSLSQLSFDRRGKENIILLLFASAVIESMMVLLKFFVSSYYVHMLDIGLAMKLASLTAYIPDVGGAFQQKNLFASWTATGITASLYYISRERFRESGNLKKSLIYFSLLMLSAGLFLASSRGGLISTALAILILFSTGLKNYSGLKRHLAVWMLVFVIGIAGGLTLSGTRSGKADLTKGTEIEAKEKAKWLSDVKQRSFAERLIMYDTSYVMFKDKPLFGQGFSNFGSVFMYYKADVSRSKPVYKGMVYNEFISHPHNEIFYILAECGIAGIFAVCLVLFGIGRLLYRAGIRKAGLTAALFTPLLFHMMIEYPLKLSTVHTLLFIILLYFITSDDVREKALKPGKVQTVAALVLAGLLYAATAGYTLKTYFDYDGYSRFKELYMNTGIISEKDILPATKNIYLRNWAYPDYMFRKVLQAIDDPLRKIDKINEFLAWNENEKMRRPGKPSYNLEGLVYLKLGQADKKNSLLYFDKAIKVFDEGLALYPNDRQLKSLRNETLNAAIMSYQR